MYGEVEGTNSFQILWRWWMEIQLQVDNWCVNYEPNCISDVAACHTSVECCANTATRVTYDQQGYKYIPSTDWCVAFPSGTLRKEDVSTHLSKPYEHRNCAGELCMSRTLPEWDYLPLNRGIYNILVAPGVSIEPWLGLGRKQWLTIMNKLAW